MNRRNFIKKSSILSAGISLAPFYALGADDDRLVILHTNDWHSHIDPFPANDPKYAKMGGAAARMALITKIRKQHKNVLLLDSGDIFQGTPYFNFYGGELEFKLMSEMGYDFATLGNHDFDGGLEGLAKQLPFANFEFLNANYDFSNTILANKFKPYRIIRKGRFKVGIFGVGIELNGLVPEALYGNTKYADPIKSANEIADHLRAQKCNLIICLSHLGFKYENGKVDDIKLAQNSSNIDLILGGHTHTFLDNPLGVSNQNGKIISINQVGWAGINLGRIDYKADSLNTAYLGESTLLKIG